jgi:hypothetical protein
MVGTRLIVTDNPSRSGIFEPPGKGLNGTLAVEPHERRDRTGPGGADALGAATVKRPFDPPYDLWDASKAGPEWRLCGPRAGLVPGGLSARAGEPG